MTWKAKLFTIAVTVGTLAAFAIAAGADSWWSPWSGHL
jgi:hypothetical protein